MEFKDIGDTISVAEYNALVYLLRKFKRLTTTLKIGSNDLTSDFGNYHLTNGFKNFGDNWILTEDVTITSNDALKNCYYSFIFTVMDVNLSGEVNRRIVSIDSESTGDTGTLEVIIPSDLIAENEVILSDFNVEVVFDEHEYYTPLPDINCELSVDKEYVGAGDTCIITGVLTQKGEPLANKRVNLIIAGNTHALITDSHGEITYTYTGTGDAGRVNVQAFNSTIYFYDYESVTMTVRGSTITLGDTNNCMSMNVDWVAADYPTLIDWGDGTTSKISTSIQRRQTDGHSYTDEEQEHTIRVLGEVKGLYYFLGNLLYRPDIPYIKVNNSVKTLGWSCFIGANFTEVILPDTLTTMMKYCFAYCTGLTSVSIPASVNSIYKAFKDCTSVTDIQLWWENNPVRYNSNTYMEATNAIFTIPYGTTQLYLDAGYPANKLSERAPPVDEISISSTKDILSAHDGESATVTALVTRDSVPIMGVELEYSVEHDGTVLDSGTVTTDNNGEAEIEYLATGVGNVSVTFSFRSILQETYELQDCLKYIESGTYTGTSTISFKNLYEISSYTNIEISATIKAPNKGFSFCFLKSMADSSSIQRDILNTGVDGGNHISVFRDENGSSTVYTANLYRLYTANTELNCLIRIENGVVTLRLNDLSYTSTPVNGLKYVGVRNWNDAKTVTYTNVIVKPL